MHFTETCDADTMHLVTNVITSTANIPDIEQTEPVHPMLKAKHLSDDNYFWSKRQLEQMLKSLLQAAIASTYN